ncbi:MAG: hypothetical protein KAR17_16715, partial [Cyclobacteriaceae bacterium]|nr:hypothetical protein [Cyclobacteriaceae bacterium]
DEKKRTKEKSRQNNASTHIAISPPAVLSGQRALRNNNQTNNMLVSLLFQEPISISKPIMICIFILKSIRK